MSEKRITIPNKVTIIRILLIPIFIFVMLFEFRYSNLFAAFIFLMLAFSDFIDGYLARKKKQVTAVGKLLDPIADKILILTALLLLFKEIPLWIIIAIAIREIILTAVRIYLLNRDIVVQANMLGKLKTNSQIIAILFVILKLPFSIFILYIAVILTLVSGLDYLIKIKRLTKNEIVNIPNGITIFRFVLIAPFLYFLHTDKKSLSLVFLGLITLSDKLDGVFARLTKQTTELGSGFDSFTDWVFLVTTFSFFVIQSKTPFWTALALIPAIVNTLVKIIYAKKQKKVPITTTAKLAVGFAYLTILSILIDFEYKKILLVIMIIGLYSSMAVYLFKFFKFRAASLP